MTFHSPLLRAFTPKQLFRAGEKGVWYDPSDMSTLWQDSARTTAVTAVEQPVGCIDDKSGNGFNATQSTSASRPVLSARVNVLTKSEALDHADWTKTSMTATDGATDPNGGSTAETLVATGANGTVTQSVTAVATDYIFSVWLKRKTGTGNVDITCHSGGTWVTQSITSSWAKYTVTQTLTAGARTPGIRIVTSGDEVYAFGADLRVSNDGVGLPAYQRVNTSTDYDTAGFPAYLRFDGTDDSLATGSVDFTGTDKMTVWAGVRKFSDASANIILETSNYVSGSGQFSIGSQVGAPAVDIAYTSKGSSTANFITASSNGFDAPLTMLVTGQSDISGDVCILRVNGSQANSNTSDQGSGNYSNMSLRISGRAGNFIFNGRVYSILVRGASSTAGQISDTEGWVNSRTRAYS